MWPPSATHFAPQEIPSDESADRAAWCTPVEVFSKPVPEADVNDIHMNHNAELTAAFERTPLNGGSRRDSGRLLACHEEHNGHSDVYGRIDPTIPGPTMTTACINPSKGRFVHPTEPHGITLRQAARFQTFPDWYVFLGGLMSGGEQIGNAVPVEMGRVLVAPLAAACVDARAAGEP